MPSISKLQELQVGDSEKRVIDVLGEPKSVETNSEAKYLRYVLEEGQSKKDIFSIEVDQRYGYQGARRVPASLRSSEQKCTDVPGGSGGIVKCSQ